MQQGWMTKALCPCLALQSLPMNLTVGNNGQLHIPFTDFFFAMNPSNTSTSISFNIVQHAHNNTFPFYPSAFSGMPQP